MSQKPKFTANDLIYAYESAADFLENEEWPENDGGAQMEAYREAAKRIRAMVARMVKRQVKQQMRNEIRQTKKDLAVISDMRARNASDYEIAIALGIPENSPLLTN